MLKKVVLVTGLWHPEVGGPIAYAEKLQNYLKQQGLEARLVHPGYFGKKLPGPLRFIQYFLKILKNAGGPTVIYALDPWLCGVSAFLVNRFLGKKYLLRLGGDTIWERWVFENRQSISLREFYQQGLHRQSKKFSLIQKVARGAARLIVPNQLLKNIYAEYYQVPTENIVIIPNPIPQFSPSQTTVKNQIIYAGRLINLKNLDFIIWLFPQIRKKNPELKFIIVGDGEEKVNLINLVKSLGLENEIIFLDKMSQGQLFREISQSKIGVLSSFSDCNPNFILECLALRKPVLITKENGLTISLDNKFIFDHRDIGEFLNKLDYLLNNYEAAQKEIGRLDLSWSWKQWLEKNYQLINEIA